MDSIAIVPSGGQAPAPEGKSVVYMDMYARDLYAWVDSSTNNYYYAVYRWVAGRLDLDNQATLDAAVVPIPGGDAWHRVIVQNASGTSLRVYEAVQFTRAGLNPSAFFYRQTLRRVFDDPDTDAPLGIDWSHPEEPPNPTGLSCEELSEHGIVRILPRPTTGVRKWLNRKLLL